MANRPGGWEAGRLGGRKARKLGSNSKQIAFKHSSFQASGIVKVTVKK